ncbi:MAG: GNAT family N-acetyltransferase [Pseudomonadaceae bacterium]|nr:GNAT family N-acetyltransferase [Pseudomonadaceae bacterium]
MTNTIATGSLVSLRRIAPEDLPTIAGFEYSVSITEPHSDHARLNALFAETGLWLNDAGALAIVSNSSSQLLGTLQFYRSAPCIHGLEIGYVIHSRSDRGRGYAAQGLQLLTDYLFAEKPAVFRIQLLIEVWNTPSWKVAERSGFIREGILRSCGFGSGDPADCFVYSRTRKDHQQALASSNGS